MRGGDISNEIPRRLLVNIDCILDRTPTFKRVLGVNVTGEEVRYNLQVLSYFWHFNNKHGFAMELVGFDYSDEEMQVVLEDLNNLGTNPFNYARAYKDSNELVAELPFRSEIYKVVDIASRGLLYGSWFMGMGGSLSGR